MTRQELSVCLLGRSILDDTLEVRSDGCVSTRMKWLSKPRVITKASQPLQCPDRKARGPGPGSPQSTSYRHWLSTVVVLTIWTTRTECSLGLALACEAPGACYSTRQNGLELRETVPPDRLTRSQRSD